MRDMTEGSAHSHLWRYALPLLLGNWLQLAYNAVDSMIAGRFIGKNALAAEGIASPVMNLVILAITGLCIGAGVLMSEYFGKKDFQNLRQSVATMLLSGMVVSVAVSILCVILPVFRSRELLRRFLPILPRTGAQKNMTGSKKGFMQESGCNCATGC